MMSLRWGAGIAPRIGRQCIVSFADKNCNEPAGVRRRVTSRLTHIGPATKGRPYRRPRVANHCFVDLAAVFFVAAVAAFFAAGFATFLTDFAETFAALPLAFNFFPSGPRPVFASVRT